MQALYKDFPPGWGHLKIPTSSRRAALAALALYAPCKRRAIWAQRLAWFGTRLCGPALLPGSSTAWEPPMGRDTWEAILATLRLEVGSFDVLAAYHRLQRTRPGLALLLLRADHPVAFVKVRYGPASTLLNEARAQGEVWRFGPTSVAVTQPLCVGQACGWHYFATSALPPRLHRPPSNPPLSAIVAEIAEALSHHPKDPATPPHWTPMHGDFAPWNLRSVQGSGLWLLDWENAAWGPPMADEVFYRASHAGLRGGSPHFKAPLETILFWERQLERWNDNSRDYQFSTSLRKALRAMQ